MPQLNFAEFPSMVFLTFFSLVSVYKILVNFYIKPYFEIKKERLNIIRKINIEIDLFLQEAEKIKKESLKILTEVDSEILNYKNEKELYLLNYKNEKELELQNRLSKIRAESLLFLEDSFLKMKQNLSREMNNILNKIENKISSNYSSKEFMNFELRLQK